MKVCISLDHACVLLTMFTVCFQGHGTATAIQTASETDLDETASAEDGMAEASVTATTTEGPVTVTMTGEVVRAFDIC